MKQFTNDAITVRLGIQPPLDPEIALPGRASISDSDCAQVYGYRVLEQLRGVAAKCAFRIGYNAIEEIYADYLYNRDSQHHRLERPGNGSRSDRCGGGIRRRTSPRSAASRSS